MTKYMLIGVFEREIVTEMFTTFETARAKMLHELQEEVDKLDEGIFLTEPSVEDEEEFGYGKDWAWSNADHDCYCDWKIVEV